MFDYRKLVLERSRLKKQVKRLEESNKQILKLLVTYLMDDFDTFDYKKKYEELTEEYYKELERRERLETILGFITSCAFIASIVWYFSS